MKQCGRLNGPKALTCRSGSPFEDIGQLPEELGCQFRGLVHLKPLESANYVAGGRECGRLDHQSRLDVERWDLPYVTSRLPCGVICEKGVYNAIN